MEIIKSIIPALPGWKVKFKVENEPGDCFMTDVVLWAVVVDADGIERATSFSSAEDGSGFDEPDDAANNFIGWCYLP